MAGALAAFVQPCACTRTYRCNLSIAGPVAFTSRRTSSTVNDACFAKETPCHMTALIAHGAAIAPSETQTSITNLNRIYRALAVAAAGVVYFGLSSGLGSSVPFASASAAATGAPWHSNLALTSAASGLAAGFLHTLCGPDHLAALTPLTIGRNRFAASLLGSLWGLGHSTGQLLLGIAFALLKDQFQSLVPFLTKWAGTIVACTLIAIGGMGIYESFFEGEGDDDHDDEEKLREITSRDGDQKSEAKVAVATYLTGILYGLQPDALFVVIPALALPTKLAAFSYCLMFVIGTVLAMGGYTLFIGTASEELCKDRPWLQRNLSAVASGIAIAVGVLLLLSGFGMDVPLFG